MLTGFLSGAAEQLTRRQRGLQAEEQAGAKAVLEGKCRELENRARSLEAELEEQRRISKEGNSRHHVNAEAAGEFHKSRSRGYSNLILFRVSGISQKVESR